MLIRPVLRRFAWVAIALLAMHVGADSGPDHQATQARPIQLGTSGGNVLDRSSIYCCSGTLGALVVDGSGTQYILSNNHVLGRFNQAVVGDLVNQPGMIDQSCKDLGEVATFSALVPIVTSKGKTKVYNAVDAAIAEVLPGQVTTDGAILDIGPISGVTVAPYPGQAVQKSGRTTGHTHGTVLAVDVTVNVGYSTSCGGASNLVAYFNNQIRIGDDTFSDGGDSGSLIVEEGSADPATGLPRAVALLFAGDSSSTIANPINAVLSALNVSMVEGTPVPQGPTGSIDGTVVDAASSAPIEGATVTAGGASATTDAAGHFLMSDVATGTYAMSASALGYLSSTVSGIAVDENVTTTIGFGLEANPAPTVALPGCVIYTTSGGKTGTSNLEFTVKVVDDFGNPVAGAAVSIDVTRDGASFGSGSGATTGTDGRVTYRARNAANGVYVTTVTNISATGLTFSGAATTPANSFAKGSDAIPAEFCTDGVSPNSTLAAQGAARFAAARAVNKAASARLMALGGVLGHGVGLGASGQPDIEVYVSRGASASARAALPTNIDGIAVRQVETDGFTAY